MRRIDLSVFFEFFLVFLTFILSRGIRNVLIGFNFCLPYFFLFGLSGRGYPFLYILLFISNLLFGYFAYRISKLFPLLFRIILHLVQSRKSTPNGYFNILPYCSNSEFANIKSPGFVFVLTAASLTLISETR